MHYMIVADSSANLTRLVADGFASVPLRIVTDEKEYVDGPELDTAAMLSELAAWKGRSGTSCPNVGDWLEAFGDAPWAFAVAITSKLSGSYNAAEQAKQAYLEDHPDRKVCCLDTLTTGPEMVLIVEELRRLLDQGLEFEEVEARIRAYMQRTHLLFSLESLNNMARNGRVSQLVAKACGLLSIRVVGKASDEGTLQPLHKPRGEKKAMDTLFAEMLEHGFRGGKVRIAHGYNPVGVQILKTQILAQFPDCDIREELCGGLCCFYAEKGGILVGFEG